MDYREYHLIYMLDTSELTIARDALEINRLILIVAEFLVILEFGLSRTLQQHAQLSVSFFTSIFRALTKSSCLLLNNYLHK